MSTTSTMIRARGVRLTYRQRIWGFRRFAYTVLDGLDLDVYRGETLGVLGRNGSGKSSLLRLLNDVIEPSAGVVERRAGITSMLLTMGVGFKNNLTGRDNAILSAMLQGFSRDQALEALPGIREFSELGDFFDRPVRIYSSGMRSRLGFSTALKTRVDLLLIDETLSAGDQHFKHKAERAMLEKIGGEQTVVFVSHTPKQVQKVCNRAVWLEGAVVRAEGDVASVSREYQTFMDSLDRDEVPWQQNPANSSR